MSNEKKRILIVDDSADDIHVLMENLKQDYAVLAATSGAKALEMAVKEPHPDVILMDVMMPGMDGYESCRQLKSSSDTKDIDVIFVSAHDSTEEILSGYEAGGSDYVIKPVQPKELLQKVKVAIKNREIRATAAADSAMAMQAAMTAITSAGEQGVVLDFMRRSFLVNTVQALANLMAEATANYGLENCVQIRGSSELVHASSTGAISPLEQELLSRLKDAGRIRESGSRLILNLGAFSQLVKNMPDDSDMCGRLRDHLAILLEGAEARLQSLEMGLQLAQLVDDSNQALHEIGLMQNEQKQAAMQIMDDLMEDLQAAFMSCGLTEEQESRLLLLVQESVNRSLENFEKGLLIDEQLRMIVDSLNRFSKS